MKHREPPPAPETLVMTPEPNFTEDLAALEQRARELRDDVGEFLASAPNDEGVWIATMTDPAVCKGLGALLMLTSKTAQWIQQGVNQTAGVINAAAPTYAGSVTDWYVEGQVEAELTCGCGQCVPCNLRKQHGPEEAKQQLVAQLRPVVGKERKRLVDPRGRPLH